jgi:aminopeptidase
LFEKKEKIMPDPRVTKLAKVMVHYSLDLKPGQQLRIYTHPVAEELTLAVYEEAIKAGAYVFIQNTVPSTDEIFFKYASDAQLDYISPIRKLITETFDASLNIWTEHNTRSLSGIDPARMARTAKAGAPLSKTFMERAAKGELHWCLTAYPSNAMAQEADMSLADYREFVYGAGMLNDDDPVAFWRKEGEAQRKIVDWLKGRNQVALKGSNIDRQRPHLHPMRWQAQLPRWRDLHRSGGGFGRGLGALQVSGHRVRTGSHRYRAVVREGPGCERESQQEPGTSHLHAQY